MPPRFLTLAIIAFWLVLAGLFLARDVWPRLAPSEPLMFPVEIVDEAGRQSDGASWLVFKNGGGGYRANTDWAYVPEDDTFRSRCQLARGLAEAEPPRALGVPGLSEFHEVKTDSSYFLTRAGQMTRLEAKTSYRFAPPGTAEVVEASAEVRGAPQVGRFVPHLKLSLMPPQGAEELGPLLLKDVERDAASVPVLGRGLVLNPLHPPRRVPDLRPGQRWRVTVIDPFAVLDLAALWPGAENLMRRAGIDADAAAYVLDAEVLRDVRAVFWEEKNENVPCRVIKCALGDDSFPRLTLWAREGDGFLLKQEAATLSGDVWTFVRRPINYRMHQGPRAPGPPK